MKKGRLLATSGIIFLAIVTASCYPVRYDGPYKGRIVKAETGEPLEGVVVLGVWYKETVSPGGGVSSYYDAEETITDKDGEFEIQGKGLKIMSSVGPMHVLIFKAGYEYVGMYPWETLKVDTRKVTWEGKKAIISLKQLNMEERQKGLGPPSPPHEAEKGDIVQMLNEINKDRSELGLNPIDVWK